MNIQQLRNKAAKLITKEDFEMALVELENINPTMNVISYNHIDDVLHIKFDITVETGGFVTEELRFGKFVSLVETGVSSVERQKIIAKQDAENNQKRQTSKKRSDAAKKAAATREAKKPENNILKNDSPISFSEMIQDLVGQITERGYDKRFITDISNKSKLSSKQYNYLCKVAAKYGYSMSEKTVRAKAKKAEPIHCDHEDLGSVGYTHGDTVKCPHCGKMAEVW